MPVNKEIYQCLRTNIFFLKTAGILYTGTWPSLFYCTVVIMLYGLAVIHHGVKLKDYKELGLHGLMEQVYYGVLFLTLALISLAFATHSRLFLSLARAIDTSLQDFGARPQAISAIFTSKANKHVRTFNRVFLIVGLSSVLVLQTRKIVLKENKTQWELMVNGWTPFVIDSYPVYIAMSAFQFTNSILLPYCSSAITTAYVALSCHLCAQFSLLRSLVLSPNPDLEQMISIIKHHNAIIRFYSTFHELYSLILLCLSVSTVLLICTLGYILTDPKSTTILIINFLGFTLMVGLVTVCICWFGEQISSEAEKLREAIYYTDWFDHPQLMKKMWLIMLLRSQRDFPMTGAGLQKFDLKGLSEILSAAYSYLNMLIALRGNKSV